MSPIAPIPDRSSIIFALPRASDRGNNQVDKLESLLGEVISDAGLHTGGKLVVVGGRSKIVLRILAEQIVEPRYDDVARNDPIASDDTIPRVPTIEPTKSCGSTIASNTCQTLAAEPF